MAVVSGTIGGAFENPANTSIWIDWSTTPDTATNSSTLTASLKIKKLNSYNTTVNSSTPYSISISGTVVKSGTIAVDFSGAAVGTIKTICTYTKTYAHGSDGVLDKKSISGVVDLTPRSPGRGVVPSSGTNYVYFDIIPRGCDLTSYTTSANIGTAISVTIDRKSSDFTHVATISLSGASSASTTFDSGTGSNTKTITVPATWASVITGTSNSNCVLTVVTKDSSGSTIATITKKFTTTIPSSTYSPSISAISVSAVNGTELGSSQTVYVNTKTAPKVTVTASVKAGATLKTVRIKASDGSYDNTLSLTATTATSFTLPTITSTTGRTYTLTVTDSRGYSTSSTSSAITIQDYNPPNLTSFTATRCNSDGSANTNGTSIKVTCTYTYSSCSSLNSVSCSAKLNTNTASTLTSGTGVVVTGTLSTALNGTVYVTLGDKFTSATYTKTIGTLTCPIDIAPNNKGVAIGGISQEDGYFDIYSPTKVRSSLNVIGNLNISFGNQNSETGRTAARGELYTYNTVSTNTGAPVNYGSIIGFGRGTAGTVEICGEWTSGRGLWVRALRDSVDNWFSWTRIYTESYKPSASDVGAYSKSETYAKSEVYPRSDWDSLKNSNGYCKTPNGCIIQWGSIIITPSAAGVISSAAVTFPIVFPSACRTVQVTPSSTVPDKLTQSASGISASGFSIYMTRTNTTDTNYYWIAMGY